MTCQPVLVGNLQTQAIKLSTAYCASMLVAQESLKRPAEQAYQVDVKRVKLVLESLQFLTNQAGYGVHHPSSIKTITQSVPNFKVEPLVAPTCISSDKARCVHPSQDPVVSRGLQSSTTMNMPAYPYLIWKGLLQGGWAGLHEEDRLEHYLHLEQKAYARLGPEVDPTRVSHFLDNRKRHVLLDWMVEVTDEFRLSQETYYLAVNYLDRYLANLRSPAVKLQLLGVSCLWLASKFEEVISPSVEDFVNITACAYSVKDLVRMEAQLLQVLDYHLAVPTPQTFLQCMLKREPLGYRPAKLAAYILELAVQNPILARSPASLLAKSAIYLSCLTLGLHTAGGSSLGRPSVEVMRCATDMWRLHAAVSQQSSNVWAVTEKYRDPLQGCVGKIAPLTMTSPGR